MDTQIIVDRASYKSIVRNIKKNEQEARHFRRLYNNLEWDIRQISKNNLDKEYYMNRNFIHTLLILESNTREILKYVQTLPITNMRCDLVKHIVDLLKIIESNIEDYKEILNGYTDYS